MQFVHEFLRDRSVRVKLGNVTSEERRVSLGVPQGSVLSPLLFNAAMVSLPDTLHLALKAVKILDLRVPAQTFGPDSIGCHSNH